MILTKYRMLYDDGSWVETLSLDEATDFGNYLIVEEDINIDN